MKTIISVLSVVLLGLLSPRGAAAQSPTAAEREVLQAQAERLSATVAKDVTTVDAFLGDDLEYGHSTGGVDGKRWYLDAVQGGRYKKFVPDGMKVQIYGEAAVITGWLEVTATAGARRFRTIEVHVKRNGRWQIVHWQFTTFVPPPQ